MRRPFTLWPWSRYNPGIALFSGELHARLCLSSLVAFGSQRNLKSRWKTETSRRGPQGDAVVMQVASEEQSWGPGLAFGWGASSNPSLSGPPANAACLVWQPNPVPSDQKTFVETLQTENRPAHSFCRVMNGFAKWAWLLSFILSRIH